MQVTLSDLLELTNDYTGNYSTGVVDDAVKYRAINRAFEYVKRNLGIPSDEDIYSFYFSADQMYYDLGENVDETLALVYNDDRLNDMADPWEFRVYPEILHKSGNPRKKEFSITNINGKKQLVVLGYNRYGGQQLFTMDNSADWVASGDASGIATDTNQYYEGTGSLSFNIVKSSSTATVTNSNVHLDLSTLFTQHGFIKCWTYKTSLNVSTIAVRLYTDNSNYYTITVSVADDGTAFLANSWQKIGFAANNAVIVGSPNPTNITKVAFMFGLGASFTSAADFRIDDVFTMFPDYLDLVFYSSYKGTNAAGTSNKIILDTLADIATFGSSYPDLIDPIAQRSAINLWPQLRGDKDAYALLKADLNENMKGFSKRLPRKRTQNASFRHILRR